MTTSVACRVTVWETRRTKFGVGIGICKSCVTQFPIVKKKDQSVVVVWCSLFLIPTHETNFLSRYGGCFVLFNSCISVYLMNQSCNNNLLHIIIFMLSFCEVIISINSQITSYSYCDFSLRLSEPSTLRRRTQTRLITGSKPLHFLIMSIT